MYGNIFGTVVKARQSRLRKMAQHTDDHVNTIRTIRIELSSNTSCSGWMDILVFYAASLIF